MGVDYAKECRRSYALIGFYGDDLKPEEITAAFRREPTVGVRKGEKWITSLGGEKLGHTGSWRIKSESAELANLSGQIRNLLHYAW